MSMNPRTTTDKIRSDYKSYISSILTVRDEEINTLAREEVNKKEFVKGPYLETTLPFKDGKSLKELAEEGLISKEFSKMGKSVHYEDWKLRIHQQRALEHIINDDRNMVVSTGTGSGKTECYLYPIFNELMREKEQGELDSGVRALLIFPMNALANDQQKKLRQLLAEYPDITFGRYTGETQHAGKKEDPLDAEVRLHQEYDRKHQDDLNPAQRKSIPNELMCREYMAINPPHILLTNYAMLEYMLLRPDTAPFFDTEKAKNWKYLVVDEAHSYKGAVGTEIAFLIRRLKDRIRHFMHGEFRCIATSATLGSEDGKQALAQFASNLFGEPFEECDIITTERKQRSNSERRDYSPEDYIRIKKEADMKKDEHDKGSFLYDALKDDNRIFRIYDALREKPENITDIANTVFDDIDSEEGREAALINLIELSAAAKRNDFESALLPARYHLFVKSLEGMFAEYYPKKRVFLDRKEKYKDASGTYSVFELANCQKCHQEYIVGKQIERDGKNYLVQTSDEERPDYYLISDNDISNTFDDDDKLDENGANLESLKKYRLCLACGRITEYTEKPDCGCCEIHDEKKLVTVYRLAYRGKGMESNCCPMCGAVSKGLVKRFLTANQPATFVVGKSLYDAIPPRPINNVQSENNYDDIFTDDLFGDSENEESIDNGVIDESGRKLLVFSDNRQEAAFFAGFFENKYRQAMWRKIILNVLDEADGNELCIDDLIAKSKQLADRKGLYTFDLSGNSAQMMSNEQKNEMAAHYVMQEFISPDIATGLEGLGYVQVMPEAPLKFIQNKDIERYGLKGGQNVWNIFRFMFDSLREKGAVTFPEQISAEDEFFAPRNHKGYFRETGSGIIHFSGKNGNLYGFVPAQDASNKRLAMMQKIMVKTGCDDNGESLKNLKDCYRAIVGSLKKNNYVLDSSENSEGVIYQLNYKKWKFKRIGRNDKLFRCKKCGQVVSYSIDNICPKFKCDGELEEIKADQAYSGSYYDSLYGGDQFVPMVAREHTAQLSAQTARQYQELFEEGEINVLSCSTTFEMGVDVGELEATFQRNVPPETSNYIQRAGRAGRRTSSAAFSVTFARRNSHDMTFYQNPEKIIAGKISAPVLEVENEKIAQRHLNSVIIADFFKHDREFFDGRAERIISSDDGDSMDKELKEYLESHPQSIIDSSHQIFSSKICDELGVDSWKFIDSIVGEDGSLTNAVKERLNDINGLMKCKEGINKQSSYKELRKAGAADRLINTFNKEASINFLSAKGVLPKYGFPIDTVSLNILNNSGDEAEKIDLSRDLRMAISEFAPPSQIVANGKLWKSYAINTVPDKGWPTYVYYECPKCKRIYPPKSVVTNVMEDISSMREECPECGEMMNARKFIIPIFGFSTSYLDRPGNVGETRPKAYYSTQTQYWNDNELTETQQKEVQNQTIELKGKKVNVKYSPGGKLFALNQGRSGAGIYVCPECGFAAEAGNIPKSHKNKFGRNCSNHALIPVSLGHQFSTDILKIALPKHTVHLDGTANIGYKDQYLSVMYAILEGASLALNISRDDISGCVADDHQIILYDDTPGGSGFVKHIYAHINEVFESARQKVNGSCGCTEETSCYGCLRNYGNQHFHDMLSRGLAKRYLDWLLDEEVDEIDSTVDTDELERTEEIGSRKLRHFNSGSYERVEDFDEVVDDVVGTEDITAEEKKICIKLSDFLKDKTYEKPVLLDRIITNEKEIWPVTFWPDAHVAIFAKSMKQDYDIMRTYNWHCYMLDDELDFEKIFSLINMEDK